MDFTFIVRLNAEPYEGRVLPFADAQAAIDAAPTILQATIDYRPPAPEPVASAIIGVGAGALDVGAKVGWLGEWTWTAQDDAWWWQAMPG